MSGLLLSRATRVQPQGTQHLRFDRVVAAVLAVAEREVGVVRVAAAVLEAVGVELRIQTDPAALLAQVEQEPPDLRDAPGTASCSCGPQAHRSLPSTSPVKHSLWIRTRSGTSGCADTAASQAEGEMLPGVGEPVEDVDPRGRAESVSEPRRQNDLGTDRRRGQVRRALLQSCSKRSESA